MLVDDAERDQLGLDRAAPVAVTSGSSLEWTPVVARDNSIAFVSATAAAPPEVWTNSLDGKSLTALEANALPAEIESKDSANQIQARASATRRACSSA